MDYQYSIGGNSFFLETELDNPSQISPGQVLVYRNYVDRDAPEEFHEHAKSLGGRYYVAENGMLTLVQEKEETIAEADLEHD